MNGQQHWEQAESYLEADESAKATVHALLAVAGAVLDVCTFLEAVENPLVKYQVADLDLREHPGPEQPGWLTK